MATVPTRWLRGLTRNRAETHPDHPEPELRGRRYAVPFQTVWKAALAEAGRSLEAVESDSMDGRITGEARTRIFRFMDDVEIRVALDGEGWTQVDLTSASRVGRGDMGTNRRRILRFLRRLDRRLEAEGLPIRPPAASG